MNLRFNTKKIYRGRLNRYNQQTNIDSKNNFKGQDHYALERRHNVCDATFYNIARFLMGNEVVIVTKNEKVEGVLRGYDSTNIWLSQVFVYDLESNDNFSVVKNIFEGREVAFRDILMVKVLNVNDKTDNVLVDQEISLRKQINKSLVKDDKNFIPYFDDYEEHSDDEVKEQDDTGTSMKGDQNCLYNPEDMLKVNKERFNVKSTFSDSREEYSTPIESTDPLLQEKYDRAEKLACKIENDVSSRRVRALEDDDEEQDEETMLSAAVTSVQQMHSKSDILSASMKLNPNAPEFRPRVKSDTLENQNITDDVPLSNLHLISVESGHHQQHIMSIESAQQHQQQLMSIESAQQQMLHRLALQITMNPHTMATPQYPVQRLVNTAPSQWSVPINSSSPGQYMIQSYLQHGQLIPSIFQTRQIAPEGTQHASPGLFYSLGPLQGSLPLQGQFFVQSDQSSVINDASQHHQPMFASSLDVVPAQIQQHQLRQPHLMATNIPVLQATASANQLQQLHQPHPQAHHTYYTQPSLNHSIMTGVQQVNTGGHATFPQLIFNPQAQQQLQNVTATIQGYLPPTNNNGRP